MQISWVGWSTTFSSSSIKVLPELIGVRCKSWVWSELIGRAVQDQKDRAASTSSCRTGKIPKNNREIIFQNWQNPNKSQRNHSAIIHFCNYFAIFHLCISRPTSSLWCAWQLHAGKIYCLFFANFSATGLTLLGMYLLGYMGFEIVPRLSIQQTIFSNGEHTSVETITNYITLRATGISIPMAKEKTASRPHPCSIQNFSLDIHV